MYGIPIKLIIQVALAVLIVGLVIYLVNLGSKLQAQTMLIEKQVVEIKACNESVDGLKGAVREQTELADQYRQAGEVAEGLYYELANRPPEIRIVPRERIVEVVRGGDCNRAAIDAWDLLNGGDAKWETGKPTVGDWRNFYASAPPSAWGGDAARLASAPINFPVVSELRLYVSPSSYPSLSPPLNGQGTWIYGQITSPAQR